MIFCGHTYFKDALDCKSRRSLILMLLEPSRLLLRRKKEKLPFNLELSQPLQSSFQFFLFYLILRCLFPLSLNSMPFNKKDLILIRIHSVEMFSSTNIETKKRRGKMSENKISNSFFFKYLPLHK